MGINSTLCPLCPDGIGHHMDEEHAAAVNELLYALRQAGLQLDRDWGIGRLSNTGKPTE